jgi:hypothetical protein
VKASCNSIRRYFAVVVAFALVIGLATEAIACTPSLDAFQNRPLLEQILSSRPIVFVGTVISIGPSERERPEAGHVAKLIVEIPLRGVSGGVFEVRQGHSGVCSNEFGVGQRWFFSGNQNGSSFFDGSTLLVDEFGKYQRTGALGTSHDEINTLIPKVLTLPAPASVVRNYLSIAPADKPGDNR